MITFKDSRGVEYAPGIVTLPAGWAQCGSCHLSWNDSVSTSVTPTPSARCPFEEYHDDSHVRGIKIVEDYCRETGVPMYELRHIAADHLANDDWPEGEGMGTSDVSIHLSVMALYDTADLFDTPLSVIARSMQATGKTWEQTKAAFRLLFAPA